MADPAVGRPPTAVVALCYTCYTSLQDRGAMAETGDRATRFAAVALNDDGDIVEHRPDSSTVLVTER